MNREFDIALSFAGEDREYVDRVANLLRGTGVKVFYDKFEEANLWGKNLYDYLSDVYRNKALYTIMLISKHYAEKAWPTHERQAMQSRVFQENQEYLLPARFDDTEIPGVLPTTSYVTLAGKSPEEFVELVLRKLVHAGRTIPSEQVRASVFSVQPLPRVEPTTAIVRVADEAGSPVGGAKIAAIASNNTCKEAVSAADGTAFLSFPTRRILTVLVAHPDRPGAILPAWDPVDDLRATLPASENVGSVILRGVGYIPGLAGRLNPILDAHDRLHLYAKDIAISDGGAQPARFEVGVPMMLEDADGVVMQVRVLHIQGDISLLEYVQGRREAN